METHRSVCRNHYDHHHQAQWFVFEAFCEKGVKRALVFQTTGAFDEKNGQNCHDHFGGTDTVRVCALGCPMQSNEAF
jgi:hypothetical protein